MTLEKNTLGQIPDKSVLEELYKTQNMPIMAIAQKFQVAYSAVRKWLKFYGIPIKSASERVDMRYGKKKSPENSLGRAVRKPQNVSQSSW